MAHNAPTKHKLLVKMALGSAFVACSIGCSASAFAQDGHDIHDIHDIHEIIVTAQKREQNINDVGITVSVIDDKAITRNGVADSFDVARLTPGLNMVPSAGYGGSANFTLRGVGLNNYSEVQEAAVAVYSDDFYIAPLIGSVLGAFDLERIEVLRGPQGTLFGRSASGGLVHYISKRPGSKFEGNAAVRYGAYNERRIDAAVGGPLGDTVSVRIAGNYGKVDGWLKNTAGPNQYGEEKWGIRSQLLFTPNDNFDLLLKAEHLELSNERGIAYLQGNIYKDSEGIIRDLPADLNVYGVPGGDFNGFRDTDGDFFTGTWPLDGTNGVSRTLLSGTMNWMIGAISLTSVTGYLKASKDYLDHNDASPTDFLRVGEAPDVREFVQELRFSGNSPNLRWTVGGFYFDFDAKNTNRILFPSGIQLFGLPPIGFENFTQQEKRSYALYGQLEYDIAPTLTLIGGARYEKENVNFSYSQTFSDDFLVGLALGAPPFVFNEALFGDLAKIDKVYVSGTAAINWKPNPDTLVYASIRRGIKPGAFNTPYTALPPESMRVKEEKVTTYELGVKATLFDGTVQLNSSLWYNDYRDYQAVFVQSATTLLTNADASVYGLDFDFQAKPTDRLTFSLTGTLLAGKVKDIAIARPGPTAFPFPGSGGVAVRDRELPNAPKYSAVVSARYEWPLGDGMASFQGDVSFRGKTFFEIQNHPALTGEAYAVGNVRLAWETDRLELAAVVKNLWQEKYSAYALEIADFGGYKNITPGKPRWWGVEIRYNFGN